MRRLGDEFSSETVVVSEQFGQVDVDEFAVADARAACNDVEIDAADPAEHERRERIMHGAAGGRKTVDPNADEIRGHPGRKVADIVATQDLCAAARRET